MKIARGGRSLAVEAAPKALILMGDLEAAFKRKEHSKNVDTAREPLIRASSYLAHYSPLPSKKNSC